MAIPLKKLGKLILKYLRPKRTEIPLKKLENLILEYLLAKRTIQIENPQERQGNSKLWEKDLEEFFIEQDFQFARNDSQSPDFEDPLNFDLKTVRSDRSTLTFTIAPLTERQAKTGKLPYRMVVLIWEYNFTGRYGEAVNAIVIPKKARAVLTNWSYKGIQVKSGISNELIKEKGLLSRS